MQWKQLDWPVLVDPLNLLDVSVVPLAVLIDEEGVVRALLRDPRKAEEILSAPLKPLARSATAPAGEETPRTRVANALLFSDPPRYDSAIEHLDRVLQTNENPGSLYFARGVAYRMRHDSDQRRPDDFARAVADWQRALDLNPNQYIWRRRIQQYGPRLSKPYPFYDWVARARREISARGETPLALAVEPRGAELATPARRFTTTTQPAAPDSDGRITRDTARLVDAEVTVVPPRVRPGRTARVHLELRPRQPGGGKWSNEADPLVVWVDPPTGWSVDRRHLTVPNVGSPVSAEPRTVEFELQAPADASGTARFRAYALFHACVDEQGTCVYRRKDIEIRVNVDERP